MREEYMRRALDLAALARGRTSPNPMVGAVIVKDGRIVGQGWHRQAGTPHAEVHALRQAGDLAKDADVYVTLEPCSHYGKTPPCSKALIEAGVRRVFAAMTDPNPLVAGRGLAMLQEAGIETEVAVGSLNEEAHQLNEVFCKWITEKMPYVAVKTAMTLDGKIATVSGESRWITGAAARQRVHELRDVYDGIMVGINTVLADNPLLTTRISEGGKSPIRIIVDSQARLPLDAKLVTDKTAPVITAVTASAPADKIQALLARGISVITIPADEDGHVNITLLLKKLGESDICSILVEGGAQLNDSLFRAGMVDKVYSFIAPKIFGGQAAPTPVGGKGISSIKDNVCLYNVGLEKLNDDIMITGYVNKEVK